MHATDAGSDEPSEIADEIAIVERDADLKTTQEFSKIQTR
jgi:hypothetical protein